MLNSKNAYTKVMLLHGSKVLDTPIMGLQTGSELARTRAAIVDPRNLTVVAYTLQGPLLGQHKHLILRVADIRELSNIGMIVDSSDEFVESEDIIKIQQIQDFGFELIGRTVIDEAKHKLGKVSDYTIDPSSFIIQQLNVKRPVLKSLNDTELLIHRSQVVEVNNTTIIVRAAEKKAEPVTGTIRNYTNPFRSASPQPEAAKIHN